MAAKNPRSDKVFAAHQQLLLTVMYYGLLHQPVQRPEPFNHVRTSITEFTLWKAHLDHTYSQNRAFMYPRQTFTSKTFRAPHSRALILSRECCRINTRFQGDLLVVDRLVESLAAHLEEGLRTEAEHPGEGAPGSLDQGEAGRAAHRSPVLAEVGPEDRLACSLHTVSNCLDKARLRYVLKRLAARMQRKGSYKTRSSKTLQGFVDSLLPLSGRRFHSCCWSLTCPQCGTRKLCTARQ